MEQQTGSKLGEKYIKAVYCHPAYLSYMQSTLCEIPDAQDEFRKARGIRCQIVNICWIIKKAREF